MKKVFITVLVFHCIALSVIAQVPNYVPSNGLVGWWPFNGNANDQSGYGYHGAVTGATLSTDRFGTPNSCYEFLGQTQAGSNNTVILTDNVIDIPNYTPAFTTQLTISVWANTYSSSNSAFLQRRTNNDIDYAVEFWNGNPSCHFGNIGVCSSSNTVGFNEWHNYTYVYDGSNIKIYIDGVLSSTCPTSGNIGNNTNIMNFGKYIYYGGFTHYFFFNGKLDDIGIWDRALSPSEIENLYNGFPIQCSSATLPSNLQNGLVGYWPFCGNANDESGNGNNGAVNGATLVADRFGNPNSAYFFNGTSDFININNSPIYNFQSNNTISLSYWINASTLSSSQLSFIINKQESLGVNQDGWNSNIESFYESSFRIQNGSNTNSCTLNSYPSTIGTNTTYHIVQIYDNGIASSYLNGVLVNQITCSALIGDNNSEIYIGKPLFSYYNSKGFNGVIDDIGIWNRALTQPEITQLFTGDTVPACSSLPSNLTTGLVGYWPFCGNANDESGNGNNGTVQGATLESDRFGFSNKAYRWNSSPDKIIVANNPSIQLTNSFSLSVWIKAENGSFGTGPNYHAIIEKWGSNGDASYLFELTPDGKPAFVTHNGANSFLTSSSPINFNQWYFLAYVQKMDSAFLYVNGVLDTARSGMNIPLVMNNDLLFGSNDAYNSAWTGDAFEGLIDDIGIWNRALTASEVEELYNEQSPCNSLANFLQADTIMACGSNFTIDAGTGFSSYSWNTGATTQSINANNSGWYKCIVTQDSCTVADSVYLSLLSVQINEGDTTICAGDGITLSVNLDEFDMELWYSFDNDYADHSGNGNNGTNNGAIFTTDESGLPNKAIEISNSSFVLVGNPLFGGSSAVNEFSLVVKFKIDSLPTSGSAYTLFDKDSYWRRVFMGIGSNGEIAFGGTIPYLYYGSQTVNNVIQPNIYYEVIASIKDGFTEILVNGTQVSLVSSTAPPLIDFSTLAAGNGDGLIYIGRSHPVSGNWQHPFLGKIDDFKVLGKALNSTSIIWSTGAHGTSINVSPTQTTTYYCTITNGINSCTDSITVTVIPGQTPYYTDNDNDNYGGALLGNFCSAPPNGILQGGDCDDANPSINPGVPEICNGVDDDCDGSVDDGLGPILGNISGPAVQCIPLITGQAAFSIPAVPGATNYQWTLPQGMQILSGQGTQNLSVFWNLPSAHKGIVGPLSVTVTGTCGQATTSVDIHIQISIPVRPSSISGPLRICAGDTATYSVLSVARARNYIWTLPAGMTLIEGEGTNVIKTVVLNNYTGGVLSVSAANACDTGAVRTKNLLLNTPLTPLAISGQNSGLCKLNGVVYSVVQQPSTVSYNWTVPAGASIVNGQGSNSITVNYDSTFSTGAITVSGQNNCGSSPFRTLNVNAIPAKPGLINGATQICPGVTNQPYSVSTVVGADTYTWTVFNWVTIAAGQGTKNILLNYPNVPMSGKSINVIAGNSCGNSLPRYLSGINIDPVNCTRLSSGTNEDSFEIYPNPANDVLYVNWKSQMPYQIEIYNLFGVTVLRTVAVNQIDISNLIEGVYILKGIVNDKVMVRRFEVVR